MRLETPRLVLRPFEPDDRDGIVAMQSDVRVTGWLGSGPRNPHRAKAEAEGWIAGLGKWPDDRLMLAIAGRADNGFLGMAFVGGIGGGEYQLGYRLRHSAWGQGVATEAAQAVLDWSLGPGGLQRVWAYTRQDNHGSARVLAKIGMAPVGVRIVSGYHALVFVAGEPLSDR